MPNPMVMSLSALAALVPISVWSLRSSQTRRDVMFWALLGAALAGPLAVSIVQVFRPWQTGLSLALWMSIAASILALIAASLVMREAWRLTPLLAPYLLLMGVAATLWSGAEPSGPGLLHHDIWVRLHIVVSVATYGLCTLAAVAGAAVLLQERAIKRKRPSALTHKLPSVADALRLQTGLLKVSAAVLAVGIATGMSGQYLTSGAVLEFDHKTLLSFLAFATILFLLVLHGRYGLRGQQLARFILLAYLLLTLAYPGVKFVTEVLLAA
jgi:ABC-type uncharacterized transport system permease subunit